jgi:hypothetical protein
VPTWTVASKTDNTASIDTNKKLVDEIRAEGGNPIFTEIDGLVHIDVAKAYSV